LLGFAEAHSMPPAGAEFAFAAFAHGFGLVRGGGQAIFAVGRTAGWVAHAIEEHASPSPLRMRATYVGPDPADAGSRT
jgi:citrate synthase